MSISGSELYGLILGASIGSLLFGIFIDYKYWKWKLILPTPGIEAKEPDCDEENCYCSGDTCKLDLAGVDDIRGFEATYKNGKSFGVFDLQDQIQDDLTELGADLEKQIEGTRKLYDELLATIEARTRPTDLEPLIKRINDLEVALAGALVCGCGSKLNDLGNCMNSCCAGVQVRGVKSSATYRIDQLACDLVDANKMKLSSFKDDIANV